MKRKVYSMGAALLTVVCLACVEPYEFKIKGAEPALVVEGFISDVAYKETLGYPSDGRFFSIKLRYTSPVKNVRDKVETAAVVFIEDDEQNQWYCSHALEEPGTYYLLDPDFKAYEGRQYRLSIHLPNDEQIYSAWQALPRAMAPPMGELSFEETTQQSFIYKGTEKEVEDIAGLELKLNLPSHAQDDPVYYRWDYDAVWVWVAPLARPSDPFYRCWARNKNYLSGYTLQADPAGGYTKDLIFIQTKGNERVYEEFSLLVTQYVLNEEAYFFWKEMQDLAGPAGVFDKPPYNLQTNMVGEKALGYFSVVREQARRWRFNIQDLSYPVRNDLREICLLPYGPGVSGEYDPCEHCMGYQNGEPTLSPPAWWYK